MRTRSLNASGPPRRVHGLAAGGVLLGFLIAGPAIGAGLSDGGQPPAGSVDKTPYVAEPVAKQPANPHPDLHGLPTTVRDLTDKGVKNLSVQRDLGDR